MFFEIELRPLRHDHLVLKCFGDEFGLHGRMFPPNPLAHRILRSESQSLEQRFGRGPDLSVERDLVRRHIAEPPPGQPHFGE
jgi:hypothetical protein